MTRKQKHVPIICEVCGHDISRSRVKFPKDEHSKLYHLLTDGGKGTCNKCKTVYTVKAVFPEQKPAVNTIGTAGSEQHHLFIEKLANVLKAAFDCGTNTDNPDTCGVCHLHFLECEGDQFCVGDETNEHDIPVGRGPACPGARMRVALSKLKNV